MTVFPAGRTVVDREQVRRWVAEDPLLLHLLDAAKIADVMGALLAELEQAERERLNDNTLAARAMAALLEKYETRLARVPALVEALKKVTSVARKFAALIEGEYGPAEYPADLADLEGIVDAEAVLAEWEQA